MTGVQLYLPYENKIIPDFSMLHEQQFYQSNRHRYRADEVLWCQTANNLGHGEWYYPNGTQVPSFNRTFLVRSSTIPIFFKRFTGQIALARRNSLSGYEGLYTCIILDENRVNQTLVVGVYTEATYNSNGQ